MNEIFPSQHVASCFVFLVICLNPSLSASWTGIMFLACSLAFSVWSSFCYFMTGRTIDKQNSSHLNEWSLVVLLPVCCDLILLVLVVFVNQFSSCFYSLLVWVFSTNCRCLICIWFVFETFPNVKWSTFIWNYPFIRLLKLGLPLCLLWTLWYVSALCDCSSNLTKKMSL